MESEIKRSVVVATNRQSNGRLTLRNLLLNMTFVISRDPVIFMRATLAVCQIETVGERSDVVLLKDREKDMSKEKEKEKPQAETDGIIKHSEAISKSTKVHRKPPQSFTMVIELLLESIITFVPPSKDKAVVIESSLVIDMETDVDSSKGKGETIASGSEKEKEDTRQESSESLAKVVFILKLLKEILLMYGPSVYVLIRKDSEFSSSHGGGIFFSTFLFNDVLGMIFKLSLFDDVLAALSPTRSSISREASGTFIDVGLRSLTQTLHLLDLDHADSLKVTPGIVKVLELVTKEHVHVVEANVTKANNQVKPSGHLEHGGTENTGEVVESFSTVQAYGGSEFITDDMEHDQDTNGGYAPPSEDDYMHGTSKETRGLDNGDEGDEIDKNEDGDDEGCNDLEEDKFDQDMIEEEDEDEEDDDGRVILRLDEGMNGINVLDHIEVFGRDHTFSNDTLHVMPVEVFGSRIQGHTTSIYNILGRSGDSSVPFQHPLLMDPSSSRAISTRQTCNFSLWIFQQCLLNRDNASDGHLERNLESSSSRLDSIFRTLRNGRQGHHGHTLACGLMINKVVDQMHLAFP
ncbi:hypothetical protein Tco_0173581 [Tanacetum coccineum]